MQIAQIALIASVCSPTAAFHPPTALSSIRQPTLSRLYPTRPPSSRISAGLMLPPSFPAVDSLVTGYFLLSSVPTAIQQATMPEKLPWAKFAVGAQFQIPVAARTGYLLKYIPAFLFVLLWSSSAGPGLTGGPWVTEGLMLLHFAKRILETCFIHDFSGSPTEEGFVSLFIGGFYSLVAWVMMHNGAMGAPAAGVAIACIGQAGNLWHHLLLSRLRRAGRLDDDKKYMVPSGGLFELVACPHYFFEVVSFLGAAVAAGTFVGYAYVVSVLGMLGGRSVATSNWYVERFGSAYPTQRKNIIPWVF